MFDIRKRSLSIVFFVFSSCSLFAQVPVPTATPAEDTVRITTSIIQFDVVVTDKNGKQVTDLKPDDFLVYQDGKQQKVIDLSYVSVVGPNVGIETTTKEKNQVSNPPALSKSRIITFVVDDGNCLATVDGTVNIRESLKKFIRDQMLASDKVAIYQTRNGASLLQMYTSNKEVLLRRLDKINLIPSGSCGSTFEAIRDASTFKPRGDGQGSFENDKDKEFRTSNEQYEQEKQVIGTVGVLNFVVDRLKSASQRKSIFLLSEGIIANIDNRAFDALRELADKASRASVVINTFSAKGLTVPGFLSAQDDVLPGITGGVDRATQAVTDRIEEERQLNAGLSYLAYSTGGEFVRNKSFMEGDVQRILDAEQGYYLVAYEPDDETFKGKDFHRIKITVTDPNLKVSSRKGFFGRTDKESAPVYKTPDSPLFQAIGSPFGETGIDVHLTTLFGNNASNGNYLRALFQVQGKDLAFSEDQAGGKKVSIDVVAVLLDEKGKVAEEFNRQYSLQIPKQAVTAAQQNGLDFSADIPVKRPGIYSIRLAIRDNVSKRLGSAGDFVEIPDLSKSRFFISGLVATGLDAEGKPALLQGRSLNSSFSVIGSTAIPAVRKFSRGTTLAYVYNIYNPKVSNGTERNLTRQVKLFKDGQLVVEGSEKPIQISGQTSVSRLEDQGVIGLGEAIVPGEYVLQVIVRDKIANRSSTQLIDFEVLP
jgi:VWFA-related protein